MARLERLSERRGYELVAESERPYTLEDRLISDYDHRIHHGLVLVLFDEERRRMLAGLGLNVEEIAKERGIVGVVTDVRMRLRGVLESGQEVIFGTQLYNNKGTLLAFYHKLQTPEGAIPLEANVDVSIIDISDSKNPFMTQLPGDLLEKLNR